MNQENIYSNTTPTDQKRPKSIFFWNNADVMKWLARTCGEFYGLYGQCFFEHEITGRSLIRLTESTLERMGVTDLKHRDELCRAILKLKLKSDILEIRDLEKKYDVDKKQELSASSSIATKTH